ncbi:MAG: hypothetical protein HYS74_02130 [Parcubacteria group bacterium]|nr:hypothetical protein [Parcubacteria group bacterium]
MQTAKIIIATVVIAAVIFFGYTYFSSDGSGSLVSSGGQNGRLTAASELLALLGTLNKLDLDTSFLKTEIFQSLRDFSVTLPRQEAGRRNPFAPF